MFLDSHLIEEEDKRRRHKLDANVNALSLPSGDATNELVPYQCMLDMRETKNVENLINKRASLKFRQIRVGLELGLEPQSLSDGQVPVHDVVLGNKPN